MENGVCKAASQHSVTCKAHGRGQGASRRETLGIHRVARKQCCKNHIEGLCLMQSEQASHPPENTWEEANSAINIIC